MDSSELFFFLAAVFLGSYIQAVTGFAMGMIIVAIVGGARLLDIPTLAATISLLTILNVILAIWGNLQHIHRKMFLYLVLGQIPGVYLGFYLMAWLDTYYLALLELALGLFVTLGSVAMVVQPQPIAKMSGPTSTWIAGFSGGIVGGLFSASGPVLGWFAYRQPATMQVIKATLLACFVMTTATRTVFVGWTGGLTTTVFTYVAWGIPVVLLGAFMGRVLPPRLAEQQMKRAIFSLLLLLGLWICGLAIHSLWA